MTKKLKMSKELTDSCIGTDNWANTVQITNNVNFVRQTILYCTIIQIYLKLVKLKINSYKGMNMPIRQVVLIFKKNRYIYVNKPL